MSDFWFPAPAFGFKLLWLRFFSLQICFSLDLFFRRRWTEKWKISSTINDHAHPMGIKAEKVTEILIRIHAKFLFCFMVHWNSWNYMLWDSLECLLSDFLGEGKYQRMLDKFLETNSIKSAGSVWTLKVYLLETSLLWSSQPDKVRSQQLNLHNHNRETK